MTSLAFKVISRLQGKTLATAESCTGGMIGSALTAVPGASNVYKGGIISYCNEVKHDLLGVSQARLYKYGAVCATVAQSMALGARNALNADIAVSVTGLAGPSGDEFGNPVGTVYIGFADDSRCLVRHFQFDGDRESVRTQAAEAALNFILELF